MHAESERETSLEGAIDWFRRGLVSQGRAAELAGVSLTAFIDALAARKIDVLSVDVDELRVEVERA